MHKFNKKVGKYYNLIYYKSNIFIKFYIWFYLPKRFLKFILFSLDLFFLGATKIIINTVAITKNHIMYNLYLS